MPQNTSSAVMNQRREALDSLDFFPTPLWATRAFFEMYDSATPFKARWHVMTALDPCAGAGHMAAVMDEQFGDVTASDITDQWFVETPFRQLDHKVNFLDADYGRFDFVMMNPPFNQAVFFIRKALKIGNRVAALCRTNILEGMGRYSELYSDSDLRPTAIFQFVERVPMVKGRVDPKASTATSYAWLLWDNAFGGQLWPDVPGGSAFYWIPPSRSRLERPGDYHNPTAKGALI